MPLSDLKCKSAKAKEKPYRIADSGGLYLEVMPNGSKYWRWKFRYLHKEKRLAFGVYPEVSLVAARDKRDQARKLLADGIDPSAAKKEDKRQAILKAENTFELVAREWHTCQLNRWSEGHAENVLHRLEADVFPHLGNRPIADINAPELLDVLRKIEKRGAIDIAHRARQLCGAIHPHIQLHSTRPYAFLCPLPGHAVTFPKPSQCWVKKPFGGIFGGIALFSNRQMFLISIC